jgi:pimeloyl-ACP methyl ester carboxylesterase
VGVDEHTIEVAGSPVFYRRTPGTAVVYLHSVPTSSEDWSAMLALTGGVAVDLPGFGRSGKGGQLDYSPTGYVDFLERFLFELELEQVAIVGHGWGAAFGLLLALRRPGLVTRLALIDAVPLLDGLRWPGLVRWVRRPVIGELLMGSVNRRLLARTLRGASASAAAWPDGRVDALWEQFDQGTQRAILRLHRAVDERGLAAAGQTLERVGVPTLVVAGEADPWIAPAFAQAYVKRLPDARLALVAGAGHWPWLDEPEVVTRVAAFATAAPT